MAACWSVVLIQADTVTVVLKPHVRAPVET